MEAIASPPAQKDKVKISQRFSNGFKKFKAKTRAKLHRGDADEDQKEAFGGDFSKSPGGPNNNATPTSPRPQIHPHAVASRENGAWSASKLPEGPKPTNAPPSKPRKKSSRPRDTSDKTVEAVSASSDNANKLSKPQEEESSKAAESLTWEIVAKQLTKRSKRVPNNSMENISDKSRETAPEKALTCSPDEPLESSPDTEHDKALIIAPQSSRQNREIPATVQLPAETKSSDVVDIQKYEEPLGETKACSKTPTTEVEANTREVIDIQKKEEEPKSCTKIPTIAVEILKQSSDQTNIIPPSRPTTVSIATVTPKLPVQQTTTTHRPFQPYTVSNYERERFQRMVLGMNDSQIRRANRGRGTYEVEVLW